VENQHPMGSAPIQPPETTDDLTLPGFGAAAPPPPDRSGNRKALWISVAALTAVGAIAVPVVVHLTRHLPARLQTPSQVAGLTRDQSDSATSTADYLRNAIAAGMGLDDSVGAVYTDGGGDAHSVILVGGTSSDGSTGTRLNRIFGLLDDATDGVTAVTAEPAGKLGGDMRCGLASDTDPGQTGQPDAEMAICGWADNDTVAIAMFPNRTVSDAAELLRTMRPAIQGQH